MSAARSGSASVLAALARGTGGDDPGARKLCELLGRVKAPPDYRRGLAAAAFELARAARSLRMTRESFLKLAGDAFDTFEGEARGE